MKLIDVVNAYITAEEMGKQVLPYDLALALVKVKKQTRDEASFFIQQEQELVMRYALLDEKGNLRLTDTGTFMFKDPSKGREYEQARRDLCNTDAGERPAPVRVMAPTEIKPTSIEALEGFIEFLTEGEKL